MKESSLNVLEQYDIKVSATRKVRGAILCETDKGVLLLKETVDSEKKISMLEELTTQMIHRGYERVDNMFINKEGNFVSMSEDGTRYVLKKWYLGRECDVKRETEVLEATRNLARIHLMMKIPNEDWKLFVGNDLAEEYTRHNRELRKIRKFMRNKTAKSQFENVALKHFGEMYMWAEYADKKLACSSYKMLLEKSIEEGAITHGDYNYHNLIITQQGMATTNFEHSCLDIQAADLYYFMRKVLEKHHWSVELGRAMLRTYQEIKPLGEGEKEYLCLRFVYPEKFWKVLNSYYHSNKAWISEKNVEKLSVAISQTEEKKKFLKNIFAFHLENTVV